jgi:hypothetical protein
MAFLCSSSTDTVSTTGSTTQTIPAWYEDALKRLVAGGEAELESQPYQRYDPSKRVAPLSPTETAAISQVPLAAGSYMPGLSAAMGATLAGTRSLAPEVTTMGDKTVTTPGADLSPYMNPYTQYVTDIAQREAIRDYQKMVPQMGFEASRQGAFGGARYGVQEAENLRNLGQRLSDIETRGLESAFTAGTGLFEREAQRNLAAAPIFGNIGAQAQQLGLGGLQATMQAQALPRSLEQQQRDLEFQEYLRGQGYGMGQLGALSGLIRGVSPGGTTTTTSQQPIAQQSPLSTAAGLGLAGAGIYNLTGGKFNPFSFFGS